MINKIPRSFSFSVDGQNFSSVLAESQVSTGVLTKSGLVLREGEFALQAADWQVPTPLDARTELLWQPGTPLGFDQGGSHPGYGSTIIRFAIPGEIGISKSLTLDVCDLLTYCSTRRSPSVDKTEIDNPLVGRPANEVISSLLIAGGLPAGLSGLAPTTLLRICKNKRPDSSFIHQVGMIAFGLPEGPWWAWQDALGAVRMFSWPQVLAQEPFLVNEFDCERFSYLDPSRYQSPTPSVKCVATLLTYFDRSGSASGTISPEYKTFGQVLPYLYNGFGDIANREFLNTLTASRLTFQDGRIFKEEWSVRAIFNLTAATVSYYLLQTFASTEYIYRPDRLLEKEVYRFYQAPIYPTGAWGDQIFGVPINFATDKATVLKAQQENPAPIIDSLSRQINFDKPAGFSLNNIIETTYEYNADLYLTKRVVYKQSLGKFVPGNYGANSELMVPHEKTQDTWNYSEYTGTWQKVSTTSDLSQKSLSSGSLYAVNVPVGPTVGTTENPPPAVEYPLPWRVTEKKIEAISTLAIPSNRLPAPLEVEPEYIPYVYDQVCLQKIADWFAIHRWGLSMGYRLSLPLTPALADRLRQCPVVLSRLTRQSGKIYLVVLESPIYYLESGECYVEFVACTLGEYV